MDSEQYRYFSIMYEARTGNKLNTRVPLRIEAIDKFRGDYIVSTIESHIKPPIKWHCYDGELSSWNPLLKLLYEK